MPNQIFHLNAKNYEKIRQLPNMSSLINNLLEAHFEAISNNVASVDELDEKLANIEKQQGDLLTKKQQMAQQAKERGELETKDQEAQKKAWIEEGKAREAMAKKRAEYTEWVNEKPNRWKKTNFKAWLKLK